MKWLLNDDMVASSWIRDPAASMTGGREGETKSRKDNNNIEEEKQNNNQAKPEYNKIKDNNMEASLFRQMLVFSYERPSLIKVQHAYWLKES